MTISTPVFTKLRLVQRFVKNYIKFHEKPTNHLINDTWSQTDSLHI